ncbi:MAG TPA: delta-60 repeat domain-containing protein, partial [Blastocatellia bacterium]|nr:delta-60 repeat domain-containing protein [Blastocatellia bacterium]
MSRHRTSLSLNRCAPLFFIAFFVVASSVLSVPAASPQTAADADGTLDLTFAAQGKLRSDFTDKYDALMTFALLPDGKLVVIGKIYSLTSDDPADEPFFLRRYNSDGSLDTSFGNGGQVLGTVGKLKSFSKLVPLPDGKLLAGGAAYDGGTDFGLARFNSDGSLDRSFGNNGTVLTNAGAADYASDLIVLPDGKILLGGDGGRPNRQASAFIVARYNASGSLDRTFGDNGLASVTFSKGFDTVYGFALQPDGKIVVAGERDFNAPDRSFALARFNSDGSLDNSFGSEGKVTTAFSGQRCEAYAIALQPDGKIIAAGYSTQTTRPTHILAMARYNSDGSLDRSFGNGGKVSNDFFGR